MDILIWIGVGVVLFIVVAFLMASNDASEKKNNEDRLSANHKLDEVYVFKHKFTLSNPTPYMMRRGKDMTANKRYMIGVNWHDQKLLFGSVDAPYEATFSNLSEIELVTDDHSITKTNRGSQLAGAAIGAAAFGGVGAIIGGLSGSSRTKQKVSSIDLKISVEHDAVFGFKVNFFSAIQKSGENPDGILVKTGADEAEKWYTILQQVIKKTSSPPENVPQKSEEVSLEDRLSKLWELKEAGALTDEEYSDQKRKLLDSM